MNNNTLLKNSFIFCLFLITTKLTAAESATLTNLQNLTNVDVEGLLLVDVDGDLCIFDYEKIYFIEITERVWFNVMLPNSEFAPFYTPCLKHPKGENFANARIKKCFKGKVICDETALHRAIGYTNDKAVSALIAAGADLTATNKTEKDVTPFQYAVDLYVGINALKKHPAFNKRPKGEFDTIKNKLSDCISLILATEQKE